MPIPELPPWKPGDIIPGTRSISHELRARKDAGEITKAEMLRLADEAAGIKPKAAVEKVIAERAAVKQEPARQAAAKELRGPELQQQQLEARQAATARREAEYRRRLSLSPEEAARERLLPHSDAALEHLAERKKTEKWQKQVRLELEGKSKPKLTLFEPGEHYDKTTSAKDKKVQKKRFHAQMRHEANIAPEELMFERAETAQESKKYIESIKTEKETLERVKQGKARPKTPASTSTQRGTVADTINPPPRSRGTILVDIDSTLFDDTGDKLYRKDPEKYLEKMQSDPKYSKLKVNEPLTKKLQVLRDAGYDLKLWTDRDIALEKVTTDNLKEHRLTVGKGQGDLFSELIMGGATGGRKLDAVPGNVVGIIDDAYKNFKPIRSKGSVDINLTGKEKLGTVARIKKSESNSSWDSRLIERELGGTRATQEQMKELKNRNTVTVGSRQKSQAANQVVGDYTEGRPHTTVNSSGKRQLGLSEQRIGGAGIDIIGGHRSTPAFPELPLPPDSTRSVPRNSSAGNHRFYLDVEATDIGLEHKDKIVKGKKVTELSRGGGISRYGGMPTHKMTAPVQITQFYGGTEEEIRTGQAFHKHMELDIPKGITPKEAELLFEYKDKKGSIEHIDIDRIMTSDNLSPEDEIAKKAMSGVDGPQGKFVVRNPSVLKNITANRLANPTGGSFGIGVNLVGSTLNTVLGRSVFEAKYGRENLITSEKFVSESLTKMMRFASEAKAQGKTAEIVTWNTNYDLPKWADQVDTYGKNVKLLFPGNLSGGEDKLLSAKEIFKTLFVGTNGTHSDMLIRTVDAADKVKDIQFWNLVNDEKYNVQNISHRHVEESLTHGGLNREQITDRVLKELSENRTEAKSHYVKSNTQIRAIADDVASYRGAGGNKPTHRNLAEIFFQRMNRGRGDMSPERVAKYWQSDEGLIVNTAAKMIKEVGEIEHATGASSMEVFRRHLNPLRHLHGLENMLDRLWRHTEGTGGIMGFDQSRKLSFAREGSLLRETLEMGVREATGFDTVMGNSLGAQGGVAESLIFAKDNYTETHNHQTNALGFEIEQLDSRGSAHDASVDVKRMMDVDTRVFNEHLKNPRGEEGHSGRLMGKFLEHSKTRSAHNAIDRYIIAEEIQNIGSERIGEFIPEPQTISNAGDTAVEAATSSRPALEGRPRGLKGRGGVFATAALTLAGLTLIGNRNGAIKHPGSKHNMISGVSPSGDPLLHSFGSGVDHFSSQAMTSLQYGTQYGSNTIRSSMLGYRGDRLRDILLGRSSFDDYTNSSEKGTNIHNIIESEYLKKDIAQAHEHVVHSPELDVMGHIDLVLKSGVPLEIKSVEDIEALQRLKSPKEAHVSQANFYAYALKQPYALIGYAARNDPNKIKYFKINTDIQRLTKDVSAVRGMMSDLRRQGHVTQNYSVYQSVKDIRSRATQDKYQQNAVGMGMGLPSGMMAPPDYSAVKGLGDYGKHIKPRVYRQENHTSLTNTQQFKGKSKIRSQGKHAALHGNDALKYRTRVSHPNGSRQRQTT